MKWVIYMEKTCSNIRKDLQKNISRSIECRQWRNSVVLEGTVDTWAQVFAAGKAAAGKGYKGVVNRLEVKDLELPPIKKPLLKDGKLQNKRVDVLIIGGGIIGSFIARELSKWNISILLVDKEEDLAMHTSSRNDGMIHAGFEPRPGTRKAYFNSRGNRLYHKVAQQLGVPFRRKGSLILFDNYLLNLAFPIMRQRALLNGVDGIRLLGREEIRKLEPAVSEKMITGVYLPTTGVLSPYKMTVACAENAVQNGAEVSLNTIVLSMECDSTGIVSVETNRGTVYPRLVINAAGVYSDKIAAMAGDQFFTIHPRKGQAAILDKKKGHLVNTVVARPSISLTKGNTKGGGLVKTIDDNILVGPDAVEQPYREDYSTDRQNIEAILKKHLPLVPGLGMGDVITYFAGIRAATYEEDFIVERSEYVNNLIHAAGIQSPGLASAPAIAEEVENIACKALRECMEVKLKANWNPIRRSIPELNKLSMEERSRLIAERPDYGVIVCRCEEISKGEIIDAVNSNIPVLSLDGIKRRVRPGMGRCQGGFCSPNVVRIIQEETGVDMLSITKKGGSSYLLKAETKAEAVKQGGDASEAI